MSERNSQRRHELWHRIQNEPWMSVRDVVNILNGFIACVAMNRSLIKHYHPTRLPTLYNSAGDFVFPFDPTTEEPTAQQALHEILCSYALLVEAFEDFPNQGFGADTEVGIDFAYQVLRVMKVYDAVSVNLENFQGPLHEKVKQWMNVHVRGQATSEVAS